MFYEFQKLAKERAATRKIVVARSLLRSLHLNQHILELNDHSRNLVLFHSLRAANAALASAWSKANTTAPTRISPPKLYLKHAKFEYWLEIENEENVLFSLIHTPANATTEYVNFGFGDVVPQAHLVDFVAAFQFDASFTFSRTARALELLEVPLWSRINEEYHASMMKAFSVLSSDGPDHWDYWRTWLQHVISGQSQDWEMNARISEIGEREWKRGPEHIAKKIEEIRAAYLAEKLPLAEKLDLNRETGKFAISPVPLQSQPLIGATLSQVSDALDDVLENPANGLNDRSRETRVIRRTVERYGNDPQRIEMDFTTVHAGLVRQVATEDLPPSEENTALIDALREGAQAIRATHPDVAENRATLQAQAFAELDNAQKQTLAEAQPILEDISEGLLKEDFAEDIPFLLEEKFRAPTAPELGAPERNPVLAGYAEKQRTLSRAAKMLVWIKRYPEFIKAIEGNSLYKTASIIGTLGGLVALGLALL